VSVTPTDQPVTSAIEAEIAKVLAERTALKRVPGTHAKQDALLAQAVALYDQLHALTHG
jgi:hypothetical protein